MIFCNFMAVNLKLKIMKNLFCSLVILLVSGISAQLHKSVAI